MKHKIVVSRYGKPAKPTPVRVKLAVSAAVLLMGVLYGWMLAGAPAVSSLAAGHPTYQA